MANTKFQLKRSVVPGKIPASGDLDIGELALNLSDAKIFSKHSLGNIITLSDYEMANSANIIARASYSQANTATTIGQSAFVTANSAASNTVLIQTVNDTQNTNITAAFTQANNAISNTVLIQSVDATQNTNITSAFTQANNAISNTILIQGVDNTQNTNITAAFIKANVATTNAFSILNVNSTLLTSKSNSDTLSLQSNGAIVIDSDSVNNKITIGVRSATTSQNGVIQLYDSYDSTSITLSPTANALNFVYNLANTANSKQTTGFLTTNYKSQEFVASNNQTIFTITDGYSVGYVSVYVNGVLLPQIEYTANNGSTIILTTPAGGGDDVIVNKWYFDRSIYLTSTLKVDEFVASNNQTSFITANTYTSGFVNVYRNGILLSKTEYVAFGGTNVTLNSGASANDSISIQYWGSDQYDAAPVWIAANTALNVANGIAASANLALITANNAISNTVLIQGVDNTQNTNITATFTQANNAISNTVSIRGVDNTQNTNITSAFTQANTANINAANASYLSTGTVSVSLLGSGTANANTYLRGDGSWAYVSVSGGGGASVTIANTAPATPTAGNLWWDSSDGEGTLRIYYTDIDSSQWVDAIPNPSVVQNQIALTTAYTAFDRANGAFSQANGAYAQANGAFAQANGAVQKTSSNGSAIIPVGMTSQRDVSPSVGYFRYNSNTSSFEGYTTSGWGSIGLNVNGTFTSGNTLPITDNTYNLGSPSYRWANLYTADMHFSNEGTVGNIIDGTTGNWTLQEGEDNIFMINNKTGKKYKIKLEEV